MRNIFAKKQLFRTDQRSDPVCKKERAHSYRCIVPTYISSSSYLLLQLHCKYAHIKSTFKQIS